MKIVLTRKMTESKSPTLCISSLIFGFLLREVVLPALRLAEVRFVEEDFLVELRELEPPDFLTAIKKTQTGNNRRSPACV